MTKTEQLALAREKAAATNRRRKQDRLAEDLRAEGWKVLPPEASITPIRDMLDWIVSYGEHHCPESDDPWKGENPKQACGPCVAEESRRMLRDLGLLRQPNAHRLECCVCS